jgi:adenylate cyclase
LPETDPEQDHFADGITALSRFPSLFVIARNSRFTYKGRVVGRELGVRYVLDGSVRRAGNHVRITGQHVEAEAANHVWVDRYERELADIFALQDEMTATSSGALLPSIERAEMQHTQFAADAQVKRCTGPTDAYGAMTGAIRLET